MRNPSNRRARTARSGFVALVCAVGALLALPAQAAWLVSDTRAQRILENIRDDQRNGGSMYELTEDFRDKEQPTSAKWTNTSNGGIYRPYSERTDNARYAYDMLGNLTNMNNRADDYGMAARCGETASVTDSDLWSPPPVPSAGGGGLGGLGGGGGSDPIDAQKTICQRTVVAENRRFNETRKMMFRIQQRNTALKRMSDARSNGRFDDSGKLAAESNNLQMFIADADVEIQYGQAVIAAYDGQINSLQRAQNLQAKRALNGAPKSSGGGIGGAIGSMFAVDPASIARATSMCAALSAFKSDRSDFDCGTVISDLF